ncbi:carbonate dehydratase [Pseudoduganella namucuonensis]|uniref:Carbonic anhydrase n=1 Tax=Pseudoduganella namucuonensis TaxID=1035707 RepID=A0A1I7LRV3_9BURK|nr:carbonate dehydratase [Pseudoduganella namucuonensis]SFV12415.1 carbonic anhydrase [Pseudoduganella namucuonensis]
MGSIDNLFLNNRQWSERRIADDPGFFARLSKQQSPKYLWIGCADSRVPANEIIGLDPGEVFVHRNVANLVVHTDLNCLSVIEFAVDVLGVTDIMVVGHYGCGGVGLALGGTRPGLADNWLRHVDDVRDRHAEHLDELGPAHAHDRLCELNVIEQVANVCRTSIVQTAWKAGKCLSVHGWIYGLHDGLLRELGISVASAANLKGQYHAALHAPTGL